MAIEVAAPMSFFFLQKFQLYVVNSRVTLFKFSLPPSYPFLNTVWFNYAHPGMQYLEPNVVRPQRSGESPMTVFFCWPYHRVHIFSVYS